MTRGEILDKAKAIVMGAREKQYGKPEDSFHRIASLWSAYLDLPLRPFDVAMLMALMKVARASTGRSVGDSLVDMAGYAACASECVEDGDGK